MHFLPSGVYYPIPLGPLPQPDASFVVSNMHNPLDLLPAFLAILYFLFTQPAKADSEPYHDHKQGSTIVAQPCGSADEVRSYLQDVKEMTVRAANDTASFVDVNSSLKTFASEALNGVVEIASR